MTQTVQTIGLRIHLPYILWTRSSPDADNPARRRYIYIYIYIIGSDDAWRSYCVFCIFKRWPSAVLDFHISAILWKIHICAYIFVAMQNLVKIGLSAVELLHIFDFQNGGCPHLGFLYFCNFCEKFKFVPMSSSRYRWRSDYVRPSHCVFSIFKMAAVRHLGFCMTS